mgnify:CR=1 FL=1
MAIARKQFEFPNADFAMSLIKLDRMIETTNDIISKEAEKEGTDDKITRLTSRSADYQLQKEALIAKASQELVPQIVPAEFLNIPANIVLNYESNCVTVEYDEDTLAEYLASKDDEEEEKASAEEEAAESDEEESCDEGSPA